MYLNTDEVHKINSNIKEKDFLCFFQHLGNPRFRIEERLIMLKQEYGEYVLLFAYERISASLVFIFKNEFEYLKSLDIAFPVLHGLYGEGTESG